MSYRYYTGLLIILAVTLAACSKKESAQDIQINTESDSTLTALVSDSLVLELEGVDSISVFDLLLNEHQVDYFTTSAGVFVKGIDSVGGDSKLFWVYSVNDTVPDVAADRYITRDGDRVKWHFRYLEP